MDDTGRLLWEQVLVPLCPCRGQSSSSGRPHSCRCPLRAKLQDLGQSIGNKGIKTSGQGQRAASGTRTGFSLRSVRGTWEVVSGMSENQAGHWFPGSRCKEKKPRKWTLPEYACSNPHKSKSTKLTFKKTLEELGAVKNETQRNQIGQAPGASQLMMENSKCPLSLTGL